MEAIKQRIVEEVQKRVNKWPFWVRLIIMIIGTILCIFYHFVMTNWRFKDCPKELCPGLSVFDNTNKWRFPEKSYATNQQYLTLEVWIWLWVIFIPEWRKVLRLLIKAIQRLLRGIYNRCILRAPTSPDTFIV